MDAGALLEKASIYKKSEMDRQKENSRGTARDYFWKISLCVTFLLTGWAFPSCKGHAGAEGRAEKQEKESAMEMRALLPGVAVMRSGAGTWYWIKDNAGEHRMPLSLFSGASAEQARVLGIEAGIPASVSVFLLEKEGKRILFDAGNGREDSFLPKALDSLGVSPASIDYVFLTHLHGDHIGGLLQKGQAFFPSAKLFLSKAEHKAWIENAEPGKNVLQHDLMEAYRGRVSLFDFSDTLPCSVVALDGHGHTPGHTVFRLDSVLVWGDLMHGMALQARYPEFCADYDMDKRQAVSKREYFLKMAREQGLTVLGMHLPPPGVLVLDEE